MNRQDTLKAFGLWPSLLIFGSAGLVLFLETHYLIPWLKTETGIEPVIFWFLLAGLAMFLPLLIIAYFMLRAEKVLQQPDLWHRRLRFGKMDRYAWWWTAGSVLLIGLLSTVVMNILEVITGPYDQQPPFMRLEPLSPGRYWILLAWLPYWLLNIMGEEILWRGVIFPRQEIVFGAYTWLFHGFCWSLFHLAFGWQLLLMMLPILFIQSLAVQKTKNTWVGVLIHAVINGPSFIAIALGIL